MFNYDFELIIPEEVIALMEKRFILQNDIAHVVDYSRKNKERFFNPTTSEYLARLRLDNVTFWVQYEEKGDAITIKNAYSHRMEIIEE